MKDALIEITSKINKYMNKEEDLDVRVLGLMQGCMQVHSLRRFGKHRKSFEKLPF